MANGEYKNRPKEIKTKDVITVGEVKPDGSMTIDITRVLTHQEPTKSEVYSDLEPINTTNKETIDSLLSEPGTVDLDALMRLKDPRFRVTAAAYTA